MFFFQAEDGIRDLVRSRGLGDVYKRQKVMDHLFWLTDANGPRLTNSPGYVKAGGWAVKRLQELSLIHI